MTATTSFLLLYGSQTGNAEAIAKVRAFLTHVSVFAGVAV
jgi:flavodoxin